MSNWLASMWWFLPTVGVLLHVGTILYILYRESDDVSERTFWLLTVTLLPVAGIVLFLFFGIVRIRPIRRMSRQHDAFERERPRRRWLGEGIAALDRELTRFHTPAAVREQEPHRLFEELFPTSLLLEGNGGEILRNGTEAYPRMLADIRQARHTIRMQSFILMSDRAGRRILRALEAKAAEGVDVKVLYDGFGSFFSYFSRYFLRLLLRPPRNFEMRPFSPLNLLTPWQFQLRNHRKLLVIDGRVAYSGGMNISEENEASEKAPPTRRIHDLHARLTGPAVIPFLLSFFQDWAYTTRHKGIRDLTAEGEFPAEIARGGNTRIRVLSSGAYGRYLGTRDMFFAAVTAAQRSVTILTPYFVPGATFEEMLRMAAARGVEVRLVVPRRNNHWFVDLAARSSYRRLVAAGIRIFERRGAFSHIKAMLVDDAWGFMGSSNCDNRSFRLNFELDFCFEGGELMTRMRQVVRAEFAGSEELPRARIEAVPFLRRLAENCCSLLSPIL